MNSFLMDVAPLGYLIQKQSHSLKNMVLCTTVDKNIHPNILLSLQL